MNFPLVSAKRVDELERELQALKAEQESVKGVRAEVEKLKEERDKLDQELSETRGRLRAYVTATKSERTATRESTRRRGFSLTYSDLRECYRQSSIVRACIDTIVRELSNLTWSVVPVKGLSGDDLKNARIEAQNVARLFYNPNSNSESFGRLLSKMLRDLLVLDAGVIEKVRSRSGKIVELWARDGASFFPNQDEHGRIKTYIQVVPEESEPLLSVIELPTENVIYLSLFPRTESPLGMPIIESIYNEVGCHLYALNLLGRFFEEDEIPPGILNVERMGEDARRRLEQWFEEHRGLEMRHRLAVVSGSGAKWIDFKRSNEEMQMVQLLDRFELAVMRAFGIQPIELGVQKASAGAEVQERLGRLGLIRPIAKQLEYYFTTEIVQELSRYPLEFKFIVRPYGDELKHARAAYLRVRSGISSINEERDEEGLPPKEGGDEPFIVVGRRVFYLSKISEHQEEMFEKGADAIEDPVRPIVPGLDDSLAEQILSEG